MDLVFRTGNKFEGEATMPNQAVVRRVNYAEEAFKPLKQYLSELSADEAPDADRTIKLLRGCWGYLEGFDLGKMSSHKLDRMEDPEWKPPELRFVIERHGAMAMGSTWAEIEGWTVDLDLKTATACEVGRRQVGSRAAIVKVKPIAQELAASILAGRADDRLQWKDCDTARVMISEMGDFSLGCQETIMKRRRRLHAALAPLLNEAGWLEGRWWVFSKAGGGASRTTGILKFQTAPVPNRGVFEGASRALASRSNSRHPV